MTDGPEWGPWVEHDGKGCPCVGEFIDFHCAYRDKSEQRHMGRVSQWFAASGVWHSPHLFVFLRYRIRKPRGLTILEGLLENLPEKEGVE